MKYNGYLQQNNQEGLLPFVFIIGEEHYPVVLMPGEYSTNYKALRKKAISLAAIAPLHFYSKLK